MEAENEDRIEAKEKEEKEEGADWCSGNGELLTCATRAVLHVCMHL